MMAHAAASQARVTHGARPGNTRGATGMSARVVAPVAPLRARTPGPQMTRRTPTLALNLAAASEGDGATAPPGGGAASTEKKRRRRRRAPKKKTADGGAVSAAKPKAAASGTADDTKSAPSKPNGRAASPPSPSKSSGGAVFMGTIDLDDNDLDDVLMRSLASRPDPNAVFRGTIDDDDLDLFATFDASDIDAKVSAAASRLAAGDGPVPPPNGGHPDLAFLYDAAAVASIAGSDDEGVNAVEVVARCNESIKRSDSMDSVLALVREMTHAGIEPTESTYFAVMLVCRNNPNVGVARAMDVYEAMVANSVNVSRRTFDLALECSVRARRVAEALRIKDDAETAGHATTPRTYASLLNLLVNVDVGKRRGPKPRLIRTCKLFEEMLAKNVEPPPAAFNSLIVAAQRAKQPDLVARSFQEMVNAGVTPSRETYETTLSAVSAGGMADAALEVFGRMRRDGFEPRKSTYNSLLEACATAPQPRAEQAFEIYYAMAADGKIAPNKRTFSLLIDAATRASRPDLAFDAFESMRTSGDVEMGLDVYNRLIHACGSRPDGLRRALGLFEEIKADESMEPDAYTYGSLLGACAASANATVADATVSEMLTRGMAHNRVTRHAYITALGRAERWAEALTQYTELKGESQTQRGESRGDEVGVSRESFSLTFDALLGAAGAEAAIASCALEPGGGDAFMRGERAAAARSVFRDGVEAGVYEDPILGLDTSLDVSVDLVTDFMEGDGASSLEKKNQNPKMNPKTPLRVSFMSMTRSEAIVATMVLLESFTEVDPAAESLPSGLFIGAGPGTRGNAQRRMLAVESVLRAAELRCETIEDPRTYVIGVTRQDLNEWVKKHAGAYAEVNA